MMRRYYSRTARWIAEVVATPGAFTCAVMMIVLWALTGPIFGFSDTWQLIINTATTVVTFLMVFLIQYAQNRDARTLQLKLDEVIKSLQKAHNEMIDLDRLSDEELADLESRYKLLGDTAARHANSRHVKNRV
jgi:low affinity Fe/Cu permease